MALHGDETDFMNLREWDRRAQLIRAKQTSRRFSASYVGSFREEDHHKSSSTRTNFINISSTSLSPGYTLKEEIDPSTYSFTNALKALQAKTIFNNRDWLTQEGFALNSKWNEAEKYICNPLSGEVPMECLSYKTLSSRSFRNMTTTTMSAPLHYPNHNPMRNNNQNKHNNDPKVRVIHEDLYALDPVLVQEKKVMGLKREVGIQSMSVDLSSGSPSPAKTPPITERSLKRHVEANDSPTDFNHKLEGQQEDFKLEKKEEEKSKEDGEEEKKQEMSKEEGEEEENQEMSEEKEMKKKKRGSGCFSWVRSRQRKSKYICVPHLVKGC